MGGSCPVLRRPTRWRTNSWAAEGLRRDWASPECYQHATRAKRSKVLVLHSLHIEANGGDGGDLVRLSCFWQVGSAASQCYNTSEVCKLCHLRRSKRSAIRQRTSATSQILLGTRQPASQPDGRTTRSDGTCEFDAANRSTNLPFPHTVAAWMFNKNSEKGSFLPFMAFQATPTLGRDNFAQLQLVEDRCLTSCIQTWSLWRETTCAIKKPRRRRNYKPSGKGTVYSVQSHIFDSKQGSHARCKGSGKMPTIRIRISVFPIRRCHILVKARPMATSYARPWSTRNGYKLPNGMNHGIPHLSSSKQQCLSAKRNNQTYLIQNDPHSTPPCFLSWPKLRTETSH